jgi:hypothetical protein
MNDHSHMPRTRRPGIDSWNVLSILALVVRRVGELRTWTRGAILELEKSS